MEKIGGFILIFALLLRTQIVLSDSEVLTDNNNLSINKISYSIYSNAVEQGIIDTTKYSFKSFLRDEENVFKNVYNKYIVLNDTQSISYEEWLIVNNFGLIPETSESYFDAKNISNKNIAENKKRFVNTVRKGDILITSRGIGGLVGHAAIMATDYWVLEMPGGKGWEYGLKSNNREVSKHKWFDDHATDWTTVYRCPNSFVRKEAAGWADRNYYNPSGGLQKKKHVTYKLTTDVKSTNPSYCSKLVIHAYFYGTGSRKVIKSLSDGIIVPSTIPTYFLEPYTLQYKGKF